MSQTNLLRYLDKMVEWREKSLGKFNAANLEHAERYYNQKEHVVFLENSKRVCKELPSLCRPILSKFDDMSLTGEIKKRMGNKELDVLERPQVHWGEPRNATEVTTRLQHWMFEVQQICCGIEALNDNTPRHDGAVVTDKDVTSFGTLENHVVKMHNLVEGWLVLFRDFKRAKYSRHDAAVRQLKGEPTDIFDRELAA